MSSPSPLVNIFKSKLERLNSRLNSDNLKLALDDEEETIRLGVGGLLISGSLSVLFRVFKITFCCCEGSRELISLLLLVLEVGLVGGVNGVEAS